MFYNLKVRNGVAFFYRFEEVETKANSTQLEYFIMPILKPIRPEGSWFVPALPKECAMFNGRIRSDSEEKCMSNFEEIINWWRDGVNKQEDPKSYEFVTPTPGYAFIETWIGKQSYRVNKQRIGHDTHDLFEYEINITTHPSIIKYCDPNFRFKSRTIKYRFVFDETDASVLNTKAIVIDEKAKEAASDQGPYRRMEFDINNGVNTPIIIEKDMDVIDGEDISIPSLNDYLIKDDISIVRQRLGEMNLPKDKKLSNKTIQSRIDEKKAFIRARLQDGLKCEVFNQYMDQKVNILIQDVQSGDIDKIINVAEDALKPKLFFIKNELLDLVSLSLLLLKNNNPEYTTVKDWWTQFKFERREKKGE